MSFSGDTIISLYRNKIILFNIHSVAPKIVLFSDYIINFDHIMYTTLGAA